MLDKRKPATTRSRQTNGADGQAMLRYTIDDLPKRNRMLLWREYLSQAMFGVEVEPFSVAQFRSTIAIRTLQDLQLAKLTMTAAKIIRGPHGEDDSHFLLLFNQTGVLGIQSANLQFTLREGEAVLLDSTRPFTLIRNSKGTCCTLRISHPRMTQLMLYAGTIVFRKLTDASDALSVLMSFLSTLLDLHEDLSSPVQQTTYRYMMDLLAMVFDPGSALVEWASEHNESSSGRIPSAIRLQAAKDYIIAHFAEQLSIVDIATKVKVTERHLQRLFEFEGITFTDFVNNIRLQRAHAMLCDSHHNTIQIQAICLKVGFRDVPHFNRLFRKRYGRPPIDVRKDSAHPKSSGRS